MSFAILFPLGFFWLWFDLEKFSYGFLIFQRMQG